MKQWTTCLDSQQTQPHEKTIPYELPYKPCEVVSVGIHFISKNMLPCIVDYYSKLPIMKKVDGLSADDLVRVTNIVFTEFGLLMKVISDTSTNFVLD